MTDFLNMENACSSLDELYMYRCLQLARNGEGSTSPNPKVGAVIVCNGRIIGEGFHIRAGEPHAEVNAVRSVKESDRCLLSESTIYVSLEPCSHYGKTPPCCDLIIECGIPRVVIGVTDSNEQVNGEGIARMRSAGIDVVIGVLERHAVVLNKKFFTLHNLGRPYVTLKWAQTADGYIDRCRKFGDGEVPLRISSPESQVAVHKLRAQNDAILVGTNTALLDNPSLTLRYWHGRTPLRLVIDCHGVLPSELSVFDESADTVLYTNKKIDGKFGKNVKQVVIPESTDLLSFILSHLREMKINSLLVEGGARLLQSFIDASLWDAIRIERNNSLVLGNGVEAPILPKGLVARTTSSFNSEIIEFVR